MGAGEQPPQFVLDRLRIEVADDRNLATCGANEVALILDHLCQVEPPQLLDPLR